LPLADTVSDDGIGFGELVVGLCEGKACEAKQSDECDVFSHRINVFLAAKIKQNSPQTAVILQFVGNSLCVLVILFSFHHGSDFLGLDGVDVTIGIAEAEGTVVAATHGKQSLHREVKTSHEFLGEG